MRRRRRERPDAQLGRWVCDGLVPMPLPTRLAREVARAADFDALHAALARIEHAFIECRIDHDQVAALRQQHRRRFYALADEEIVTRQTRDDPRGRSAGGRQAPARQRGAPSQVLQGWPLAGGDNPEVDTGEKLLPDYA